jgi:hypothetical protein
MKLITETIEEVQFLTESDGQGNKTYFIEGPFMQADTLNRNKRVYPQNILLNEVNRYDREYVQNNRAFGELNHPTGPTVNLDRVSHIIKEFRGDGSNVWGKAKIMETPMGKIVKNLIDEGARLGVSSRGMGSLKQRNGYNEVQPDFMLSAVDIVADPSAPGAFVNGIMENKEWLFVEGRFVEVDIVKTKQAIQRAPRKDVEKVAIRLFENFLSKL